MSLCCFTWTTPVMYPTYSSFRLAFPHVFLRNALGWEFVS